MKRLVAILICLIAFVWAFGCSKEEPTAEPTQIPIPPDLADEKDLQTSPGHLEMMVERTSLKVAKRPFGIAMAPDGKRAYVASAEQGEISVLDVFDLDVIETWGPFGEYLFAVLPSNNDKTVFSYGLGGENLLAIDAETGRLREKIAVGRNISDAVIGPNNTLLIASAVDRKVTILDQDSLEIKGTIKFSHPIGYIAVGENGDIACATGGVYIVDKGKSKARRGPVSFFDPSKSGEAEQADVLRLGAHTRKPIFVEDDNYLLAPDRIEGTVRVFDVRRQRLLQVVDVGSGPEEILTHPKYREAYTINTLGRSVSVLNLSPFELIRTISLPANPEDGIVSPDGKYLYLTLPASAMVNNRIAVIDIEQRELVDLIPTGKDPCRMALSPDGKSLFVTNFLGNTVSIIR